MDDPKYAYDPNKEVGDGPEKQKNFSPLMIPILLGWTRQMTKHKNFGKRSVYYVAPCGRRLRNMVWSMSMIVSDIASHFRFLF